MADPAKRRWSLSKIVTILLLRLKGGLNEDAAWAEYESNCRLILGEVKPGSRFSRGGIKEFMKKHDVRCKPRIE
jgi:hypothetical protein